MKYGLYAVAAVLLFSGCEFKTEIKAAGNTKVLAVDNNGKIKNGIILKEKGFKVEQAYLTYEDGTLVPATNQTGIRQKVVLRLIIEEGWKEVNGKVFPGGSETIQTNTGKVFIKEDDLFKSYERDGVSKQDASIITLSAMITEMDRLYDYFLVKFRVWDKKSGNEVTGSYKLYIK